MLIEKILIGLIVALALLLKLVGLSEELTLKVFYSILSLKLLLLLIYTYLSREYRFVIFTGLYVLSELVYLFEVTEGNFDSDKYFLALPPAVYGLFIFYRIIWKKTDYQKLTWILGGLGFILLLQAVLMAMRIEVNPFLIKLMGYGTSILAGTLVINTNFAQKLLRVERYLLTYLLLLGVLQMIDMIESFL